MALDTAQKAEIVAKFAKKQNDTGSSEVQIALLTKRIVVLTAHLQENPKDFSSRLGLLKLVGQRKRLMRYLKAKDYSSYTKLIKELNLRDKYFFGLKISPNFYIFLFNYFYSIIPHLNFKNLCSRWVWKFGKFTL